MKFRCVILALLLLAAVRTASALPETSAGSIHAVVTAATGELRIYGPAWSTGLLVTVKIDNHIYTNNAASPALRFDPAVLGQLRDTIVVRWTTQESVDVDLRCYPYDQDLKLEISFTNRSASSHTCAAEVLQSYTLQGTTNPYLGTDRDYSNIAREIPGKSGGSAPQLYYLGVSDVGAPPYHPGVTTGGRFSGKGLDLLGPQHLYFGVWSALAVTAFGPPNELPVGCDGGLLLVWNPMGVSPNESRTIARWLMGRGVQVCSSSDVVLFSTAAPLSSFSAHTVDLMSVAYSVNQRGLTNSRELLHVDSPLSIIDRHPGGTLRIDTASLGGDIVKGSARTTDWRIISMAPATSLVSWSLSSTGDNVQPLYRDGCEFSFDLPNEVSVSDRNSPVIVRETPEGGRDSLSCTNRAYHVAVEDSGSGVAGYSISGSNFEVTPEPFIPGTDSANFVVSVIDPLQDGQAEVTFLDRVRYAVKRTYSYCSVQDTSAPIVNVASGEDTAVFTILEKRPWDLGIQDFLVSDLVNAYVDSTTLYQSIDSVSFTVRKLAPLSDASLCIVGRDKAGNVSSRVCWTSVRNEVPSEAPGLSTEIVFDQERHLLSLSAGARLLELYDVLGRLVLRTSASSIDLSSFSAGTYIVRVVGRENTVAKRISVR